MQSSAWRAHNQEHVNHRCSGQLTMKQFRRAASTCIVLPYFHPKITISPKMAWGTASKGERSTLKHSKDSLEPDIAKIWTWGAVRRIQCGLRKCPCGSHRKSPHMTVMHHSHDFCSERRATVHQIFKLIGPPNAKRDVFRSNIL